jgi:hypothetical protein
MEYSHYLYLYLYRLILILNAMSISRTLIVSVDHENFIVQCLNKRNKSPIRSCCNASYNSSYQQFLSK